MLPVQIGRPCPGNHPHQQHHPHLWRTRTGNGESALQKSRQDHSRDPPPSPPERSRVAHRPPDPHETLEGTERTELLPLSGPSQLLLATAGQETHLHPRPGARDQRSGGARRTRGETAAARQEGESQGGARLFLRSHQRQLGEEAAGTRSRPARHRRSYQDAVHPPPLLRIQERVLVFPGRPSSPHLRDGEGHPGTQRSGADASHVARLPQPFLQCAGGTRLPHRRGRGSPRRPHTPGGAGVHPLRGGHGGGISASGRVLQNSVRVGEGISPARGGPVQHNAGGGEQRHLLLPAGGHGDPVGTQPADVRDAESVSLSSAASSVGGTAGQSAQLCRGKGRGGAGGDAGVGSGHRVSGGETAAGRYQNGVWAGTLRCLLEHIVRAGGWTQCLGGKFAVRGESAVAVGERFLRAVYHGQADQSHPQASAGHEQRRDFQSDGAGVSEACEDGGLQTHSIPTRNCDIVLRRCVCFPIL
mmetsp:Transcript_21266/g.48310  ORF Transcript_21266/g.48310 Transcript_21266/m.48310 type:complete len:473 (+) Transcript_21266:837-2255(+)